MNHVSSNFRYKEKVKINKGFYEGYLGELVDFDAVNTLCLVNIRLSLDKSHHVFLSEHEFYRIDEETYLKDTQ
jgi:uncharacterized membrane protein YfhO